MTKLKIVNQDELKDWAKEIFKKNSFNMVDVSSKKETYRRALASGKIYVGKEVFNLIKNKEMPKGDLRLCLFGNTGISVRHLLQRDDQLNELKDLILKQMQFKKESHYLELGETGSTKNLSKTGG